MSDAERTGEGPARGYSWAPFEKGNRAAVKHGVYATLQLTPRAAQIADWIWHQGDHLAAADGPAVETLALTLAHLERADEVLHELHDAIERGDAGIDTHLERVERRSRISADARRWVGEARKLMDSLGLTPHGRAQLDERLQVVVHVHEVRDVLGTLTKLTSEFVAPERRAEFLTALNAANAELAERGSMFALPPGEQGDP